MRLPELTPLKAKREIINRFAGYNHRDVILDGANNDYASGEWYDCNNLTSDKYPTAAVRGKKGTFMVGLNTPSATELFNANGNLGYVSADSVYIKTGDTYTGVALPEIVYTGEKRVVTMGAYVIVFPHKFYVNSADLTDKGAFGGTFRAVSGENSSHQIVSGNYLNVKTCLENGTEISPVWLKPANPSDGAYWCDNADKITYKYHSDTEQWVKVETYQKFMLGRITATVCSSRTEKRSFCIRITFREAGRISSAVLSWKATRRSQSAERAERPRSRTLWSRVPRRP